MISTTPGTGLLVTVFGAFLSAEEHPPLALVDQAVRDLGDALTTPPEEFTVHTKLGKLKEVRSPIIFDSKPASQTRAAPHEDATPDLNADYYRYVAEAPLCGNWPTNLAQEPENAPYKYIRAVCTKYSSVP